MAAAVRAGIELPVPSCPGWTTGDVLTHVGKALNWMAEIVETRSQTPVMPRPNAHGHDWRAPGVFEWFERGRDHFLDVMESTDPEMPGWSWAGENRVIFRLWLESMETALHRWDEWGASGRQEPIDPALAIDGVDATIRWFLPHRRTFSTLPDGGESYRFDQTDGPGSWLVWFSDGTVRPGAGEDEADCFACGCASDILLFLWHRVPPSALATQSGAALLERFARLAPPI
jgi:uncharacterized protein (TIGR03083 family)